MRLERRLGCESIGALSSMADEVLYSSLSSWSQDEFISRSESIFMYVCREEWNVEERLGSCRLQ